jgi:TRAP-type mannitol/chloroaromatic compound transport system substrate-binding protein
VDKNAGLTFGSGAPFGLTAAEHASWLRFGGGMDLISGLYDKFGIVYFPAGNTGSQMGGWFNNEIRTTDDLDGLRMRIGGIGAEVMKRTASPPSANPTWSWPPPLSPASSTQLSSWRRSTTLSSD